MTMTKAKAVRKLLVMRFSAMGDVAMTVPVVTLLARQYPDLRITVLTRKRFVPMYEWAPANVEVLGIDLNDYEGVGGLTRLFRQLHGRGFDAVADLHDVLRTKFVRTCFRMSGTRVAVIDKGRKQKKEIVGNGTSHAPLRLMTDRYADVFAELGLPVSLEGAGDSLFDMSGENMNRVNAIAGNKMQGERWVGIAPFAAHDMKVYPLEQMHKVADTLAAKGCKVFLFGAGKSESDVLATWEGKNIISVCGKLGGLHDELLLMSKLNLMISMDSANMHMAAMIGTQTLSVWGPTHPKAGFTGWRQSEESIVQVDGLECRPCSIYGNKPCALGDHRCMAQIVMESIVDRAMTLMKD